MNRMIKKVAVIGSGVMGSRIACHFANIGVQVLLLDITPRELTAKESAMGFTLDSKAVKNRIVNEALQTALTSNPSPIYSKSFASRIETGNLTDDLPQIASCDWIIEVIVERLDIKQQLFENVEKYRKPGTLISSNTSGIPLHLMANGRSDDFKAHFAGTHFFNPPRYLKLLEVIPTPHTLPEVTEFYMDYGKRFLGKTTVLCKDTPAFIANRIGVASIMQLFHAVESMELTVDEVDKLTGPVLGRPKSATFRTCDVVGLDTLVHVANGLKDNCPNDEANSQFALPSYIDYMVQNNWLGSKSGQGFYKKVRDAKGKSEILSLNLKSLEYEPKQKVKFAALEASKTVDNLVERTKLLYNFKDKAGKFYQHTFTSLFSYVSNRIPEITDAIYKVDDALKAGFGWSLGPFESWDAIVVANGVAAAKSMGLSIAPWVEEMLAVGCESFYKIENGNLQFYNQETKQYEAIPGREAQLSLDVLRHSNTIWKNKDCSIINLGDGILNLEFHSKMNTIGSGILNGINKAIDLAEKEYKGLVISNTGDNFSAGANVGMIFMLAIEQEWEELDFAIRSFQKTMMRARYSSIPVVAAPHNMALGGGCELCMHADKVVAHAELYMGLVEFGVGVIPGGGGTKEFALRFSDELNEGDMRVNHLRNRFLTVGQAKVSTSAQEAFELGYLRKGIDSIVVNRDLQLAEAKKAALQLADQGYSTPVPRKDILALGKEGLGIVYVGANTMQSGNYISEHDQLISQKLGYVLCGGDLSQPTKVSEQYLLNLERKAFLELCQQRLTLERMQSLLTKGKILRN